MSAADNCVEDDDNIATLDGTVAPYLQSLGMAGTGTLVTKKTGDTTRHCTHYNDDLTASWADATNLAQNYGWSFVSHTATYPGLAAIRELHPGRGVRPDLRERAHDRRSWAARRGRDDRLSRLVHQEPGGHQPANPVRPELLRLGAPVRPRSARLQPPGHRIDDAALLGVPRRGRRRPLQRSHAAVLQRPHPERALHDALDGHQARSSGCSPASGTYSRHTSWSPAPTRSTPAT